DTQGGRLSQRMGLTVHKNPVKIERDLMQLIPKKEWTMFGHHMIYHGRRVCKARRPRCDECAVSRWCPKIGVGVNEAGAPAANHVGPGQRPGLIPKATH